MRSITEIEEEITKVNVVMKNAELERSYCIDKLLELHKELISTRMEAENE